MNRKQRNISQNTTHFKTQQQTKKGFNILVFSNEQELNYVINLYV